MLGFRILSYLGHSWDSLGGNLFSIGRNNPSYMHFRSVSATFFSTTLFCAPQGLNENGSAEGNVSLQYVRLLNGTHPPIPFPVSSFLLPKLLLILRPQNELYYCYTYPTICGLNMSCCVNLRELPSYIYDFSLCIYSRTTLIFLSMRRSAWAATLTHIRGLLPGNKALIWTSRGLRCPSLHPTIHHHPFASHAPFLARTNGNGEEDPPKRYGEVWEGRCML